MVCFIHRTISIFILLMIACAFIETTKRCSKINYDNDDEEDNGDYSNVTKNSNEQFIDNDESEGQLKCGDYHRAPEENRTPRLADAGEATQGWFPFIVRLELYTQSFRDNKWVPVVFDCTGAIIDSRHVLTAASCLRPDEVSTEFRAVDKIVIKNVGNVRRDANLRFDVVDFKTHDRFRVHHGADPGWASFFHNIAIVKTSSTIELAYPANGMIVNSVCLPPPGSLYLEDASHYIIGWGHTKVAQKEETSILRYGIVRFERFCSFDFNSVGQLCYRALDDEPKPCVGDHGAVLANLVQYDEDPKGQYRWQIVGLYSNRRKFQELCESGQFVATNISAYLNWITRTKRSLNS